MSTQKIILPIALLMAMFTSQAQVSVNVTIGTPPVWAPAAPVTVAYYYLPDIQVYYDVPARTYIYFGNGAWRRSRFLPARYRGYNLAQGHTIYLSDYHGRTPYAHFKEHKIKYRGNNDWKTNQRDNGNRGRKATASRGRNNSIMHSEQKGHGDKKEHHKE
jgi:hypothetical protein